MEEKHLESLKKVGLTKPEAKVYLSLIELKESQTGALCENSKIPSSNIYSILDSLIKKGFVNYRIQNNIKIFMPSNPEIIKDIFKEKQKNLIEEGKEIENLIETLKFKQSEKEAFSKYKYFEGMSGIRAMWIGLTEELNELSKEETILMYAGVKKAYESMLGLYEAFHNVRVKKGIKYKIIYSLEETEVAKRRKRQLAEVKFIKLENEAEWGVMGNKFFVQYITQKVPRGFLIEDEIFAETFKQVFNQIWKQAKE
jgi:HTH-type transcriptional regulator, sugar sensing transcriptional regulator